MADRDHHPHHEKHGHPRNRRGDEDNIEYPDPVLTQDDQVTPAPPPKPPKDDEPLGG